MSSNEYTEQARRLQSFLRANPEQATALSEGKLSTCLEAVAALHGARNWNTLSARGERPLKIAMQPSQTRWPLLEGYLGAGEVEYVYGKSGTGKSLGTRERIAAALKVGYKVTILDVGRSYTRFADVLGGVHVDMGDTVVDAQQWDCASIAIVEFEEWRVAFKDRFDPDMNKALTHLRHLLVQLEARTKGGSVLVLDEVSSLLDRFGVFLPMLTAFLAAARKRGTVIICIGQGLEDFLGLALGLPCNHSFKYAGFVKVPASIK
jgi:type IV secretory pathway VirB4 component